MNHRENGLFIQNCATSIARYASCGHGCHGKIDQIIAIKNANLLPTAILQQVHVL